MPTYEDASAQIVANALGSNGVPKPVVSDPLGGISAELDGYYARLKDLAALPPVEVFQILSAISARVSELRVWLVRQDQRKPNALRTKEVDPLLEEVDRQFKIHSRIHSVRTFEWEMDGKGQV